MTKWPSWFQQIWTVVGYLHVHEVSSRAMLNQEFGQSSSAFYSLSLVSWQLWMTTTFYFCPKQVRFYPSGHKGSSRFCGLKCVSPAKTLVSLVFRFKMQT